MIEVLCSWIYVMVTAGVTGCAVLYPFYRIRGIRFQRLDSYLYAGLIMVTVYAQIYSLFGGVALGANVVLVVACLGCNLLFGKKLREMVLGTLRMEKCVWDAAWKQGKGTGWLRYGVPLFIAAVITLLFAYGTSAGYMMYDSNLYHAQSIRWIEEYGVVPGLGNLHSRFAYNSASFALTALYSMKFLTGQSLHTIAGLLAWLAALDGLRFLRAFRRKRLLLSDFARVGELYYISIIFREMTSPASDYFTLLLIFYLVIRWLDLLEREEESTVPYSLLCLVAVFAITVKMSAGIILLLVCKPAWMLLKEKRWKEILCYLGLGILIALPFFIRNVIISGFPVYPYSDIDFFNVDWRMPVFTAQYDMLQIQSWAKGITYVAAYDLPISKWLPYWFVHELSGMEKLWVLASACALVSQIGAVAWMLWKKKREEYDVILVLITLTGCYLFWQFSAPMIRYGYAYPLLLPLVVFGLIGVWMQGKWKKLSLPILVALLCVLGYRGVHLTKDICMVYAAEGIHCGQQDYDQYEAVTQQIGGMTVYVPKSGDQIGYDKFPSTPDATYVLPRGERIEDGFVYNYDLIKKEQQEEP